MRSLRNALSASADHEMPLRASDRPIVSRPLFCIPLIVLAAAAAGHATLRGTFVGADDYRLVLNHVLVNHPSLDHAVRLFSIVHRDLYQPIPLLSFSGEFAIAKVFGIFDRGVDAGAWLFHLTNVILHALNAALVWTMVRRFRPPGVRGKLRARVATYDVTALIAALLFAVHPLQVEVVAWINGRMMLLSTLFALLSIVCLNRWFVTRGKLWPCLVALCTLLCATSKIRICLPLLLLIAPLAQRRRLTLGFGILWTVCTAIVAAFVVVNYQATSNAGMFEGAAENLQGSHLARGLLSLAWYFEHYLWPGGLASWYPAPAVVHWLDGAGIRAAMIASPILLVMVWASIRSRETALALAWFFAAIASTLQVVPTRNALAADRYMYLPIIGFAWATGVGVSYLYALLTRRLGSVTTRIVGGLGGTVAITSLIAVSLHVSSYYDTAVKKTQRLADLFPTTPHIWERHAWACYNDDRFLDAIESAANEFQHRDNDEVLSDAHYVTGAAQRRLGRSSEAVRSLEKALQLDSKNTGAVYQLFLTYDGLGDADRAIRLLEQAVQATPLKNPWINRLAKLYQNTGRPQDARRLFEQSVRNNPYEVPAILGLAELDIAAHSTKSLTNATNRLQALLAWMPENAPAWVSLGVAQHALGEMDKAQRAYRRALQVDPNNTTAALNLAQLVNLDGDTATAWSLFEQAAAGGLTSIDQLIVVHDFVVTQGRPKLAIGLWRNYLEKQPNSKPAGGPSANLDSRDVDKARGFLAWSLALANAPDEAQRQLEELDAGGPPRPLVSSTRVLIALSQKRYAEAMRLVDELGPSHANEDSRKRLMRGLALFLKDQPELAWPWCVAARTWVVAGEWDRAASFAAQCSTLCNDEACRQTVKTLDDAISQAHPNTSPNRSTDGP